MEPSRTNQPLPHYAEEILETVTPWLASTDNGLSQEELTDRLEAAGFEPATIEAAFEPLIERGYLFGVHNQLRLTDPNG